MQEIAVSGKVKFFQKINQFQWLILLLMTPLFLFIRRDTCWILLIVPLLWGISFLAGEKPIKITPINELILLLAVQVLVSLYATYDIAISLPKIGRIVYSLALFFAFIMMGERFKGVLIGTIVLCMTGLGKVGLGLLGMNWATTKIMILNPDYEFIPGCRKYNHS